MFLLGKHGKNYMHIYTLCMPTHKIFLEKYTRQRHYWLSLGRRTGSTQDRVRRKTVDPFEIRTMQMKNFFQPSKMNCPHCSWSEPFLSQGSCPFLAVSTRGLWGMNTPSRRERARVVSKPKSQGHMAGAPVSVCLPIFLLTQPHELRSGPRRGGAGVNQKEPQLMEHKLA